MSEILASRIANRLFGHEEAERRLLAEKYAGRLPHGIILAGPRGIGKATLAYRLAHALLSPPDGDAVIQRIAAGSHADLLVLEPLYDEKKEEYAREISVDQAREVARFLSMTAAEGDWRVVIIDSADALNTNAANAILKILEEPPPQAVLLLVSHNPGMLLPTIRSRCRMVKLSPPGPNDFTRAAAVLLPDAPEHRIEALAQLSGFAPGLASELQAEGAAEIYEEILHLLGAFPAFDAQNLHAFAERMTAVRQHANWRLLARLILFLFERVTKLAAGLEITPVAEPECEVMRKLAGAYPPHVWAAKWQQALDQFTLAEARHLDYRQMIIAFFHGIASRDGLALGVAA